MLNKLISYLLIRIISFPLMIIPFKLLHKLGKILGFLAFYILINYRKRTLSNLALATDLKLTKNQIKEIAIKSFQNLAITIIEYPKLSFVKDLSKIIKCENPDVAMDLYNKKKGIIFFCAHQSNWEVLFLDGTSRMKGIAIGKPIKNKILYNWILKIRQKNNGRIIDPKNALIEGLRNLKKGIFLGIVGDQGMPISAYSFPFFGRRAWTSTAPALLSYKTNSPIIFATTRRENGKYFIKYSNPIWPDLNNSKENEVKRLMNISLTLLQDSIKERPHEWLWQHNRWKQQTPNLIYKRFRHDCICIILPKELKNFEMILPHLPVLKAIYNKDFIYILCSEEFKRFPLIDCEEVIFYKNYKDTLLDDYRFKLIYNFTQFNKINSHFLKLSAFEILTISKLKKIASKKIDKSSLKNLSMILESALCRKPLLERN